LQALHDHPFFELKTMNSALEYRMRCKKRLLNSGSCWSLKNRSREARMAGGSGKHEKVRRDSCNASQIRALIFSSHLQLQNNSRLHG